MSFAPLPFKPILRASILLCSLVLTAPLAACSGKGADSGGPGGDGGSSTEDGGSSTEDGGSSTEDGGSSTESGVIGAEGGTVQSEGGAQVDVPAGALDSDVALSIEQGVSPGDVGAGDLPDAFTPVTTVVLTPHGTTFSVPATLSLPYSGTALGDAESELVLMRLDDLSDTEWEPYGHIETGGDVATTEIDGFSVYSLANVAAGACPCWSGAQMSAWKAAALADGYTTRNSWVNTGRVVSQTCNFVSSASGSIKATHTTEVRSGNQFSCSSYGEPAYGGSGTKTTLDATAHAACRALLVAPCFHDRSVVQLAVYSPTLPTGGTVSVTVTATDSTGAASSTNIAVDRVDELFWSASVYSPGTTYTVAIATQPADATCSVVEPTGTFDTDNVAVEIDCTPTDPTAECPCADFTADEIKAAYDAAILLDNQEIGCFMGAGQTSFGESPATDEVSAFEVRGDGGGTEVSRLWGLGNLGGALICRAMTGEYTVTSEASGLSDEEYAACLEEVLAGMDYAGVDPTTCEN